MANIPTPVAAKYPSMCAPIAAKAQPNCASPKRLTTSDENVENAAVDPAIEEDVAVERLNFRYEIFGGAPSWRPLRVRGDQLDGGYLVPYIQQYARVFGNREITSIDIIMDLWEYGKHEENYT
jgi:hypothetical protein